MKSKNPLRRSLLYFIVFLLIAMPGGYLWAAFNSGLIISDHDLTDYQSMDMGDIQNFLQNHGSFLSSYVDPQIKITAAQAIYDAAKLHQISPKYILVLLQKEQSLISDPQPTQDQLDWATGYGICDGCHKTDLKVQKYKGFVNQVDWGAGGTRYYFDHPEGFKFQVGGTYNIDGQKVTILNHATRALYTYTPHLHGNQNLYRLWQNWFSTNYLDGTLLQDTQDGGIYLIRDGKKHPFLSKSAFLSRYNSFSRVLPASPADLDKYPTGAAIKYPNYSLLQVPGGGVYLLDDDTLRPIVSRQAFRLLGFNPEEIISVQTEDIFFYKIGQPITTDSAYPTGALLQDKKTGGVYYVQDGIKYPLIARELIKLHYPHKKITPVSQQELAQYKTGEPVKLKDGELATSPNDPAVYFISQGKKHAFASAKVFESLGYKWKNIVTVPQRVLDLHPTGEMITENN